MNRTYNYSVGGQSPLAANSLRTGDRPSLKDVKQHVPQEWDRQAMRLGMLGEGSNWPAYEPSLTPGEIVRLGVR